MKKQCSICHDIITDETEEFIVTITDAHESLLECKTVCEYCAIRIGVFIDKMAETPTKQ